MSHSNIDLVRSLYDAFDRRDQAAVAAAMDPFVGRTRGRVRASGKPVDISIEYVWRIRNQDYQLEPHIDTPAMLEALAH